MIDKSTYHVLKRQIRCFCRNNVEELCKNMELTEYEINLIMKYYDKVSRVQTCMDLGISTTTYSNDMKILFSKIYNYKNTLFMGVIFFIMEGRMRFELMNIGVADQPLNPLEYLPIKKKLIFLFNNPTILGFSFSTIKTIINYTIFRTNNMAIHCYKNNIIVVFC